MLVSQLSILLHHAVSRLGEALPVRGGTGKAHISNHLFQIFLLRLS